MSGLWALMSDHTVQTVALGAAILGVISGVLGSFAVLRRQSLLGDALSHAALPGICLGFLVAGARDPLAIMAGAFVTGALAALAVMAIGRLTRLRSDAALGIVLSVFFAFGVVLLTVVQGKGGAAQAGLSTFLFGQAAAMLRGDIVVMGAVAAAALAAVAMLWKEFQILTFDRDYARTLGLAVTVLDAVLTVMVALAIVVGLQLVGVVLMTAMLIAPAAAARQWVGRLGPMVVLAALFGLISGVAGAVLSTAQRGLSTGPVIVLVASAIVVVSLLVAPGRGILWRVLRDRGLRRRLDAARVLATLRALGQAHGDPAYPAEGGMIDAYHGTASAATLRGLEAAGLIRPVTHPPETTPHWELTPEGRRRAEGGAR